MAQRLIQNNFVSGELAPDLYGRVDIRQYFQSAALIDNFVPKKTGGIRKRAGTELVKSLTITGADSAAFRLFPFFRSRTQWSAILMYRKAGSSTIYYRTILEGGGFSEERSVSGVTQLPSAEALAQLKAKQIGDTMFFVRRGMRAFKAKMHYDEEYPRVEWSSIPDVINVAQPKFDSVEVNWPEKGKREDLGYMPSTRTYALFGVKSGVYSAPVTRDVGIWLQWIGGAYVRLRFTPDFSQHDYYVMAIRQGADWGVVATYYPSVDSGTRTDVSAWGADGVSTPGTIGDYTYYAGTQTGGNIPDAIFRRTDPETTANVTVTEDGEAKTKQYHTTALLVTGDLTATYKSTAPLIAVRIWFGGLLRRVEEDAVVAVDEIGTPGDTTVELLNGSTSIQKWHVSSIFSNTYTTLAIDEPVKVSSATYTLRIKADDDTTPVVVRGIVLVSDSAQREFKDEYYSAGSVTGIQERLTVGDGGMDCGVVDVWQQRLMFASSQNLPFTMWFSQVNDLYNFYADRPQTASDAFSATIPAVRASRILHSLSGQWLMLFTEGGEYEITGGGSSGFSFATINIRKTSNVGAHGDIEPIVAEQKALFVAADGRTVYDLAYSLEQDNIIPRNRSVFVPHLTERRKIVKMAYQRYPDTVVWVLLDDGDLLSFTYLPEQEVYAWARHTMPKDTGLKIVDINSPDTTSEDNDWTDVTSDILLTLTSDIEPTRVWIERLRPTVNADSAPIFTATCADHMGYAAEDCPAAGNPQRNVLARLVTLRPETPQNNSMGWMKNVHDSVMRLYRSGTLKIRPFVADETVGFTSTELFETGKPTVEDDMVKLVNGDVKVLPYAFHNETGQLEIESADEWPCEILSLGYVIDVGYPPNEGR